MDNKTNILSIISLIFSTLVLGLVIGIVFFASDPQLLSEESVDRIMDGIENTIASIIAWIDSLFESFRNWVDSLSEDMLGTGF